MRLRQISQFAGVSYWRCLFIDNNKKNYDVIVETSYDNFMFDVPVITDIKIADWTDEDRREEVESYIKANFSVK